MMADPGHEPPRREDEWTASLESHDPWLRAGEIQIRIRAGLRRSARNFSPVANPCKTPRCNDRIQPGPASRASVARNRRSAGLCRDWHKKFPFDFDVDSNSK